MHTALGVFMHWCSMLQQHECKPVSDINQNTMLKTPVLGLETSSKYRGFQHLHASSFCSVPTSSNGHVT